MKYFKYYVFGNKYVYGEVVKYTKDHMTLEFMDGSKLTAIEHGFFDAGPGLQEISEEEYAMALVISS